MRGEPLWGREWHWERKTTTSGVTQRLHSQEARQDAEEEQKEQSQTRDVAPTGRDTG